MIKLNKILFAFLMGITSVTFITLQFVETEFFSKYFVNPLAREILAPYNIQIGIKNIKLQIYPPATFFNKVQVYQDGIGSLNVDEIGAYFHLSMIFQTKYIPNKIIIRKGFADILIKSNEHKKNEIEDVQKIGKVHDLFIKIARKFKISEVGIESLNFHSEEVKSKINNLKLVLVKDNFDFSLDLTNVEISKRKIDTIYSDGSWTSQKIKLDRLKIVDGFNSLSTRGEFNFHSIRYQGEIEVTADSDEFFKFANKENNFGVKGNVTTFALLDYEYNKQISIKNGELKLGNLEIKGARYRNVEIMYGISENKIAIKKATFDDDFGNAKVENEFKIFDIKTLKVIPFDIHFRANNFNISSVITIVSPALEVLKAEIFGDGQISIDEKENIKILIKKNSLVKNMILNSKAGHKILNIPEFKVSDFSLEINKKQELKFEYDLNFKSGRIDGTGFIGHNDILFNAKAKNYELQEFGKISDVPLLGKANLDITVSGPFNNANISFIGDATNFRVVGLNLGDLNLNLELSLSNPVLKVVKAFGKYKSSYYSGNGYLDFTSGKGPNLEILVKEARIENVLEMCFSKIEVLSNAAKKVSGILSGKINILGTFGNDGIEVNGNVDLDKFNIFEESFDKGKAEFKFSNNTLNLKEFNFKKGSGRVKTSLFYDLNSRYIEYDLSMDKIPLNDFYYYRVANLGLTGELNADLFGSGTIEDLSTKNIFTISKSKIKDKNFKDSFFKVFSNGKDFYINTLIGGGIFSSSHYLNFDSNSKKSSNFSIKIKTNDIKDFLGFLSLHNVSDKELKGEIDIDSEGSFNIFNMENFNGELSINKFYLKKNLSFLENENSSKIKIVNGAIKEWHLGLSGAQNFYKTDASGSLKAGFKIVQSFNFPIEFLEILTPVISRASGSLKGIGNLKYVDSKFQYSFDLEGDAFGLRSALSPITLDDASFILNVSGHDVLIEKFKGKLGKGNIDASGRIKLSLPYPELNLSVNFDKTLIPLFKQSSLVFSGNASVLGRSPPYNINSNLYLVRGEIRDDLNYIRESFKQDKISYKQSAESKASISTFTNYYVNFNFDSPLLIKNQLVEFYIIGPANIWGTDGNLSLQSKIEILPGQSKVFFKGHEFLINRGIIEFDKINGPRNPLINMRGSTKISNYNIIFDGNGFLDSFSVTFRSEPSLPQEDILSLLTIGVTNQVSKTLQTNDLQAVTSMSLGSILMDQFGINENLNKSVGMKLSVLPELDQRNINPIQGRTGVSDPTASRLRSSTKLKLQKKVKELDFSFSSTFGGSMQQKQEMNVNYNLRPDVSVQGVYEIYSTDTTNNRTTPDSAGFDLIWKKSW